MELVAVRALNLQVLLEEALPDEGHLSLKDVLEAEFSLAVLASDGKLLLAPFLDVALDVEPEQEGKGFVV